MIRLILLTIVALLLSSCGQGINPESTSATLPAPTTSVTTSQSEIPVVSTTDASTKPAADAVPATGAPDEEEAVLAEEIESSPEQSRPAQASPDGQDLTATILAAAAREPQLQEYPVPAGSRPHDVALAPDGTVWYTAERLGELGRLDPATGETHHTPLGSGSAPHGVIVGPDGAAWVTDGGLNAIVRVDPSAEEIRRYDLPATAANANLNTATFDQRGRIWSTGQNGYYGWLDPATGEMEVHSSPRGRGPYGIATTPDGEVYYASLAGSYVGTVDLDTGKATVLDPPTSNQGARRVWADSSGRIWVSEWNAGQLAVLNPATGEWQEWLIPGERPMPYAVYVDENDIVWLSDFGANALVRFDPETESFEFFSLPSPSANVRQILGRPGEIWGAESGSDKLVVIRTR